MSRDYRSAVCDFGEKISHALIGLFDQKDTFAPILEFLRFQLAIHHPDGARIKEQGAVVINNDLWTRQLNRQDFFDTFLFFNSSQHNLTLLRIFKSILY